MMQIKSGAEDHLKVAVALAGPVTVSIDSRHSAFQVYYVSVAMVENYAAVESFFFFGRMMSYCYRACSFIHLASITNHTVPLRS